MRPLQLNGIAVEMVQQIHHHIVGNLLRLAHSSCSELAVQSETFEISSPSSCLRDDFFQAPLGSHWISIGPDKMTLSIQNHPKLPALGLRMFDDPCRQLAKPLWHLGFDRHKWLDEGRVVSLGLQTVL